ncbi:hypothetical protein Tco_0812865, partial [Tanacetum coccineum]
KEEKAKDETCLVAQASNEICLGINLEPDEWIKDSGCSKHMTDDLDAFDSYCDEALSIRAVLMAMLSAYDSKVLSK